MSVDTFLLNENEFVGTDRVIINVGGTRHECYLSTIQNFPDTRLYWIAETALKMTDFDPEENEFFFDRHPGCFQNILNYCRTGRLHCPNDVCGPLFEEELTFWGIDELMMEPCCWGNYTQHREAKKTLKLFDDIYQDTMEDEKISNDNYRENNIVLKLQHIRHKLWHTLEKPGKTLFSQLVTFTILTVTILSIATFCMETMKNLKENNSQIFKNLEIFYCWFFSIDFITRCICSPSKIKFFRSFVAWTDFLSTIQFYIAIFTNLQIFTLLFMLRLLRVFRLLHFFKHFVGLLVIGQTLKASARELIILALMLLAPMVVFSTMVYYAEQNEMVFPSIPHSFWWAIITMTTVGYGDIYPATGYGKLLGALCAFSGILIVALPISVIGNNFNFYYSYAQARMRLPKRQYQIMIEADKELLSIDDNNDSSSIEDELDSSNLSTRRSAIRSSRSLIRKSICKKQLNNFTREKVADDDVSFSEIGDNQNQLNAPSKCTVNICAISENDEGNARLIDSFDEDNIPKLRSTTMPFHNKINIDNTTGFSRLTRSFDNFQVNSDKEEKSKKDRKRVVHLDITSYEPTKLDPMHCARRRKQNSNFHPFKEKQAVLNSLMQETESVHNRFIAEESTCKNTSKDTKVLKRQNNVTIRKVSVIKRVDTERDVFMWMQEEN